MQSASMRRTCSGDLGVRGKINREMWKKKPGESRWDERRRGPRGPRGFPGPTGPQGPRGKTGGKGRAANIESLEALDAHTQKIEKELRTQLQRMAQIQQELDEVRGVVQRLMDRANRAEISPPATPTQPKAREH